MHSGKCFRTGYVILLALCLLLCACTASEQDRQEPEDRHKLSFLEVNGEQYAIGQAMIREILVWEQNNTDEVYGVIFYDPSPEILAAAQTELVVDEDAQEIVYISLHNRLKLSVYSGEPGKKNHEWKQDELLAKGSLRYGEAVRIRIDVPGKEPKCGLLSETRDIGSIWTEVSEPSAYTFRKGRLYVPVWEEW